MNIGTCAKLDSNEEEFLINCISLGVEAKNEFYKSRLEEKRLQLFDTIPKTKKKVKQSRSKVIYDVNKETVKFLRHIDYARVRGFDLQTLLGHLYLYT